MEIGSGGWSRLAEGHFVCLGDLAEGKDKAGDDEAGARLERRDSKLLETLIKEELRRHRQANGGQRLLLAAHGGTDAFAPVAAQAFMQERSLRAPPRVTFLTAMFAGWSGRSTLEGFLRECVRNCLADMADARRPIQRPGSAHIPEGATEEEAARLRDLYEQKQAVLRGEAPTLEEQVPEHLGDKGNDTDLLDLVSSQQSPGQGYSATEWTAELHRFRLVIDKVLDRLDPLDAALLRQDMGWEPEELGIALAARFNVMPSAVRQRRSRLIGELRRTLGVGPSD